MAPPYLIPLSTCSTQPSWPSSRVMLGDRIPSGNTRPRLASLRAPRAEATVSQSAGPATHPSLELWEKPGQLCGQDLGSQTLLPLTQLLPRRSPEAILTQQDQIPMPLPGTGHITLQLLRPALAQQPLQLIPQLLGRCVPAGCPGGDGVLREGCGTWG